MQNLLIDYVHGPLCCACCLLYMYYRKYPRDPPNFSYLYENAYYYY